MKWLNLGSDNVRLVLVEDLFEYVNIGAIGARTNKSIASGLLAAGFKKNQAGEYVFFLDEVSPEALDAVLDRVRATIKGSKWEDVELSEVYPKLYERIQAGSANDEQRAVYERLRQTVIPLELGGGEPTEGDGVESTGQRGVARLRPGHRRARTREAGVRPESAGSTRTSETQSDRESDSGNEREGNDVLFGQGALSESGAGTGSEPPVAPRGGLEEPRFRYGMTYRPPSIGAVPKDFIQVEPHPSFRHGVLTYTRELTADEVRSYELTRFVPLSTVATLIAERLSEYAATYLDREEVSAADFLQKVSEESSALRRAGLFCDVDQESLVADVEDRLTNFINTGEAFSSSEPKIMIGDSSVLDSQIRAAVDGDDELDEILASSSADDLSEFLGDGDESLEQNSQDRFSAEREAEDTEGEDLVTSASPEGDVAKQERTTSQLVASIENALDEDESTVTAAYIEDEKANDRNSVEALLIPGDVEAAPLSGDRPLIQDELSDAIEKSNVTAERLLTDAVKASDESALGSDAAAVEAVDEATTSFEEADLPSVETAPGVVQEVEISVIGEGVADSDTDGLSVDADLELGDGLPRQRLVDQIRDVSSGNLFETKRAHDVALLPILSRILKATNDESSGAASGAVELSEMEMRALAGYRGHLSFNNLGNDPQGDRNCLEFALQYVRMVSAWKRLAQDEPSADEKRSYGETPIDDGITSPAQARAIIKAAGAMSQFEVTNALGVSLWDIARQLGLRDGAKVFLPNSGNGALSRLRPADLGMKVTQVPNDPTGYEIAKVLHPEDVVVKGLYETLILPSSYYDMTMAVSHYDSSMNMMGLSKEGALFTNDDIINMESDTPKLNKIHHLLYKSMKMVRSGGIGLFVVPRNMLSSFGREALNRISQFSSVLAISSLDGHLVRGHGAESHQMKGLSDISLIQEANRPYVCVVLKKRDEPLSFHDAITVGDAEWVFPPAFSSLSPERVIGDLAIRNIGFIQTDRGYDSLIEEAKEAWLPDMVEKIGNAKIDVAAGERLGLAEGGEFLVLSDAPSTSKNEGIYERSYVLLENGVDVGVIRGGRPTPFMGTAQDNERIRSMIQLRGAVMKTVNCQLTSSDDGLLQAEQTRLRSTYNDFVRKHGPIHSPVNLESFKGEPSLPQLLALEVYDQENNVAETTEFFTHRVIGKPKLVEKADTAAEALAISMGKVGYVSPGIMSALMGRNWSDLLADVKGEVFMDPLEGRWVTRNQYLSGNVRGKLDSAIKAAAIDPDLFSINVSSLREVQPAESPVEETDFQIGASWIPAEDHRRFIGDLLGFNESQRKTHIEIVFNPVSARWALKIDDDVGNEQARQSLQTPNKSITDIILATLNSTPLRVSMNVDASGNRVDTEDLKKRKTTRAGIRRITDSVETAQVHLIQERLKDEFSRWAVANPLRGARLNYLYNLKVNAFKERVYDGSYLRFEKLSPLRQLMSQQINATARAIEDGYALIAHAVGSGKTATLAAIAMEHVGMGLARKPLITAPKSVITAFAGEIVRFFPAAKVLIETDLTSTNVDGIKSFIARASMDNWDIILMTHDSFRAVPLSKEAQRILVKLSLNEVDKGLSVSTDRVLEMKKKTFTERLNRINEEIQRDQQAGLEDFGFDKTGVDLILVDEVHLFKNMGIQTKMNVLGINKSESQRAVDMLSKSRYMSFVNGGKRGFVGATATAICNSISEMYPMMDLHRPSVLVSMGIRHFDSWASTFGRVQTLIEQKPAGDGWQMRDRFIRFQNVRELCRSFRMVADVRTDEDMPEVASKRPAITNHLVVSPKDRLDEAYLKSLEIRSKSLSTGSRLWRKDSVIALIGDMQRGMLDMRSICPDLPANTRSIATLAAENIVRIYHKEARRKGTQLVFCDTAINSLNGSYSIFNDLRDKLIAAGIPGSEIAMMHEADKPEQRQRIQNRMNAGKIRVCMGSSDRLGLGTNVQKRGCAMHHLDIPTRPDKLEQRIGRFWRMGNEYVDVGIDNFIYAKQGNTRRFETVQNKLIPIKQALKNPDLADRHLSEEFDQTLEEFQAELTDNPLLRTKVTVDANARHLDLLRRGHLKDVAMWSARLAATQARVNYLRLKYAVIENNRPKLSEYFDAAKKVQEQISATNEHHNRMDQALWNAIKNGRKIIRAIEKEEALKRVSNEKKGSATLSFDVGDDRSNLPDPEQGNDTAPDIFSAADSVTVGQDSASIEDALTGNEPIANLFPPVGSSEFLDLIAAEAGSDIRSEVIKELAEYDWSTSFSHRPEKYTNRPITDAFVITTDDGDLCGLDRIGDRITTLAYESNFVRRPIVLGNVGPYKVTVVGNSLVRNYSDDQPDASWARASGPGSNRLEAGQLHIASDDNVVLKIDLGLSGTNNASKLFIRIKNSLLDSLQELEKEYEDLRVAEAKANEVFELEDDWRRAQQAKAEIDAQLLLIVKESDPEADRDLLSCLIGARTKTGRPLHPDELRQWVDGDNQVSEAVLETGEGDEDERRLRADPEDADREAIRVAAEAFEAQMRMGGR